MKKDFTKTLPSDYQFRILTAMVEISGTKALHLNTNDIYDRMKELKLQPGLDKKRVRSEMCELPKKGLVKLHQSRPYTYSITQYGRFVLDHVKPVRERFLDELEGAA